MSEAGSVVENRPTSQAVWTFESVQSWPICWPENDWRMTPTIGPIESALKITRRL